MPETTIRIQPQQRKSLAMKVTPAGIQVLIPRSLAPDSAQVQEFIREGLPKVPSPQPLPDHDHHTRPDVLALVQEWGLKLGAQVKRTQLRPMRNKWGSISTTGTLTLADDLRQLPQHLVEYVIVHELLHLRHPTHHRLYRLTLSQHIPDCDERERQLAGWVLHRSNQP